jgi:hypothetical protein
MNSCTRQVVFKGKIQPRIYPDHRLAEKAKLKHPFPSSPSLRHLLFNCLNLICVICVICGSHSYPKYFFNHP